MALTVAFASLMAVLILLEGTFVNSEAAAPLEQSSAVNATTDGVQERNQETADKAATIKGTEKAKEVAVADSKKEAPALSRGETYKKVTVEMTAYCLDYSNCGKRPGDKGYGITYSGKPVKEWHTIAVDPDIIPLGSKVYIPYFKDYPNKGIFYAEDTGVKGLFGVDVYMKHRSDCLKFGRQELTVYIIE